MELSKTMSDELAVRFGC